MINKVLILDSAERVVATLANDLPGACKITALRRQLQAEASGGYSDKLTITVPGDHPDAVHVKVGNYILFRDSDGHWQEYRIALPARTDAATSSITATAEHAFYELINDPVYDLRPTDTTAAQAVLSVLNGTRWQIGSADDLGLNSVRIYYTSALAGLVAIATRWGGELQFRLTVVGGVITGRYVDILTRRGRDTGKRFEVGKDLVKITQTVNMQGLCTALIGRGKGVEIEQEDGGDPAYGRRLNLADVEWSVAGGDPVDKPLGQLWIGDEDARLAYGPGGRHIYGHATFDDCTDAGQLAQLTYEELQRRKAPLVTYDLTVIILEQATGLAHEAVRFGDGVYVINTVPTPAITGNARIISLDANLLDDRDCKVVLGNFIPISTSTMNGLKKAQQAMLDRASVWDRAGIISASHTIDTSVLDGAIDLLKHQMSATVSGFSTDAQGNFMWENPEKTEAVKIGGGIIGLANTKVGGEYQWRTFLTGAGALADEITVGKLSAVLTFAGELLAARGTITHLVAGNPTGARMEHGVDTFSDPFLDFFDDSNVRTRSIRKDSDWYGERIRRRVYNIGNKTGIGTFIK